MIKNQGPGRTERPARAGQFPTKNRLPYDPVTSTTLELGDAGEATGLSAQKCVGVRGQRGFRRHQNTLRLSPGPDQVPMKERGHLEAAANKTLDRRATRASAIASVALLPAAGVLGPLSVATAPREHRQAAGELFHFCE